MACRRLAKAVPGHRTPRRRLSTAVSPGCIAVKVVTIITPGSVTIISPGSIAIKVTEAIVTPVMIIEIVKVPISTPASLIPIVKVVSPAWSTSVPTAIAGIMTVHKLVAFVAQSESPSASLCVSLKGGADNDQERQHRNSEKVPESCRH